MKRFPVHIAMDKMKHIKLFIAITFIFICAGNVRAEVREDTISDHGPKGIKAFEFALRLDYMSVSGTTRYLSETSDINMQFPSEGENNSVLSPTLSAGLEAGKNHFFMGFNYIDLDFQGETSKPTLLISEDSTLVLIPRGTAVSNNINMNILSLIWTRTILDREIHEFGIGAGLMLIDYRTSYAVEGYYEDGSFRQVYPAPMLSIHYSIDVKMLEFTALVGGVGASINGNAIAYANMDFALRLKVFRARDWLGMISFGVKFVPFYMYYQSNELQFENEMRLLGPFLGFRLKKIRTKE